MKSKRNLIALALIMAAAILVGCGRASVAQPIIKVGEITITSRMLDTKLKIEQCYRDDKKMPERWLGLYKLVDEALMEEAAKKLGIFATPDILDEEAKRVDKETKAPELLASVKAVCLDPTLYKEVYLKPGLVNRVAHYKFAEDKAIQEVAFDKANEALKKAKDGKDLKSIEGYSEQEIDPDKITPTGSSPINELSRYNMEMTNPEKELIDTVLKTLKPGDVYQTVREDRYGFYVIKLLEKRDAQITGPAETGKSVGYYKYEMVTCKKKEFDRWFNEFILTVKKEVFQPELVEQILKNVTSGPVSTFLKETP